MLSIEKKENCSGCSACFSACPQKCIQMKEDKEGFLYPIVDVNKCINCNICNTVCPNKRRDLTSVILSSLACSTQAKIKENCSSGGVFYALAISILELGGVVFGAAFDSKWNVVHKRADNQKELQALLKSKYVQSDVAGVFSQVKNELNNNRWVLFSGTPCQVAGLKCFLKKDYERLLLIDVICHGVPSPKVWKKYLLEKMTKTMQGYQIYNVDFRDKSDSWMDYKFSISYSKNSLYEKDSVPHYKDPYMRLFLRNVILRPSCYKCHFRGLNYSSDITLGDFWGVDELIETKSDDKGVSAVIVRTKKGQEFISNVNFELSKSVSYDDIVSRNVSLIESYDMPDFRKFFFLTYNILSIRSLANHLMGHASFTNKAIYKLALMLKLI